MIILNYSKVTKRFPDLSAFRRRLPPAKTSAAKLIRTLRDEENGRY